MFGFMIVFMSVYMFMHINNFITLYNNFITIYQKVFDEGNKGCHLLCSYHGHINVSKTCDIDNVFPILQWKQKFKEMSTLPIVMGTIRCKLCLNE